MSEEGTTKKAESTVVADSKMEQKLPKLSAQDFRVYNRMAEHMDMFHNSFRQTWDMLHRACSSGRRPSGMSIRQFLAAGDQFAHHLTVHHGIEEQHIFPILAKKMPCFLPDQELLTQHKGIHEGLDRFEAYLRDCKTGERELRMEEMKEIMDSFGTVLWQHLDDEVKALGANNMRLYWTKGEMASLPI
ncbi:uncharacterized protein RCC_00659 [Ramularia collo-cygni]|uniref:Hemerythrin-like domain-containing protein n=1 Tax=Ramularia collo-cygni TaxID=112498 RepID=A0A2D3UUS2_9PEZI|nr:uncharacterized protein RCC_00659 [Ramularia collo-cygni]CZT14686.1 uncharacterized protein RCC_00659 [Ramularia collo-cygni]